MVCPYRIAQVVTVETTVKTDDGREVKTIQETYIPRECHVENCALWRDGKCTYNYNMSD
jgi:hypothetical protein